MISPSERMIAEKDGAIGWMIFNNPERRNALSLDMWQAMPVILEHFERDPGLLKDLVSKKAHRTNATRPPITVIWTWPSPSMTVRSAGPPARIRPKRRPRPTTVAGVEVAI